MGRILSPAQLARYEEDGVLFPVQALGPGPLAEFRSGFDAVSVQLGEDRCPERFGQWHLCFRWAYDLATHPRNPRRGGGSARAGYPCPLDNRFRQAPTQSRIRDLAPRRLQLEALDVPRLASAWVALSESTPENGCLRVIPGSHRRSRIEHTTRHHKHNMLGTGLHLAAEVDESHAARRATQGRRDVVPSRRHRSRLGSELLRRAAHRLRHPLHHTGGLAATMASRGRLGPRLGPLRAFLPSSPTRRTARSPTSCCAATGP